MALKNIGYGAVLGFCILSTTISNSHAQEAPDPQIIEQLLGLDLDQLLNMDVTSAARKPQKLSETASAVYVIT
jgi:hypothetical protein